MGQQPGWAAGESAFPAVGPLLGLCFGWSNETPATLGSDPLILFLLLIVLLH